MSRIVIVASLASSLRNFRGPLILALRGCGHDVHAVAPGLNADTPTHVWLTAQGVTCHDVPMARAGLNPFADLRTGLALFHLLRLLRADVFLAYTIKPVIWGLFAARLAHVPSRVALISGLGYAFTDSAGGMRGVIRVIARGLYRAALRQATLVFFQNPDDRADFTHMGLLAPGVAVRVVAGSGIDLEQFRQHPLPDGAVRFTLIARLLGDKGIREFVAAARLVRQSWPDTEFHLVGGTDSNPDAIPEAEVGTWHEAGDVHWHGPLDDVRPMLAQTHVYVLPSYREGTPRTVLEAMATGRAVITSDAPGCRQTVEPGQTGYLVPLRAAAALADAMTQFLHDPALIESFGTAGRARAEALYDVDRVNADMLCAMGLDNHANS